MNILIFDATLLKTLLLTIYLQAARGWIVNFRLSFNVRTIRSPEKRKAFIWLTKQKARTMQFENIENLWRSKLSGAENYFSRTGQTTVVVVRQILHMQLKDSSF